MDITKWKSVAVRIEDYHLLKGLCDLKYRAPAAMIGKLLNDYINYVAEKDKIKPEALKKKLMNGHVNG
jgi:hypothetical protein|tara:strand:- start:1062 stop:1265 length:204 start_codon:yes stop_codon:yes gene_type:complete